MKSSFLLFRRQLWLWLIAPILISSCTIQDTGTGQQTGTPDEPKTISFSGIATDGQPLSGAIVTLRDTSGETLGSATVGDLGHFTISLPESTDIRAGYYLAINDAGLQALYPAYQQENANITPLTTLVQALSAKQEGDSALRKQGVAIQQLADIGVLQFHDWSATQPSLVNFEHMRQAMQLSGAKAWSEKIATDLQTTGEIAYEDMLGFPQAHGGLIDVRLSEGKTAQLMRSVPYQYQIRTKAYQGNEPYEFALIEPVDNLTVSPHGIIRYTPELEESKELTGLEKPIELIEFKVRVTNPKTRKGRVFLGVLRILPTEIVKKCDMHQIEKGTPGGNFYTGIQGECEKRKEEVSWKVRRLHSKRHRIDDLDLPVRILRSRDMTGKPMYTIHEPDSHDWNEYSVYNWLNIPPLPMQIHNDNDNIVTEKAAAFSFNWFVRKFWYDKFATVKHESVHITNRLSITHQSYQDKRDSQRHKLCPVAYYGANALTECRWDESARLRSACGPHGDCANKLPVMLIHSRSGDDTDPSYSGPNHWGKLPEMLHKMGYAVYEFVWRSNADLLDAASDLASAIRFISQETGNKVNLIAHSFSGVLSMMYLQNIYESAVYANDVQTLVTIGTPHSGIFPTAVNDLINSGIDFPKGHDSDLLTNCHLMTCHDLGTATPKAYSLHMIMDYDPYEPDPPKEDVFFYGFFGAGQTAGFNMILLNKRIQEFGIPVPMKNLISLTIEKNQDGIDVYGNGNGLISLAGQRLARTSADTTEIILGMPDDAVPGDPISSEIEPFFKGYRHAKYGTLQGSNWETNINNVDHPAFIAIKDLLDSVSPQPVVPAPEVELTMQLLKYVPNSYDSNEATPIPNVNVLVKLYDMELVTATTDHRGVFTASVPFYPEKEYHMYVYSENHPHNLVVLKSNSNIDDLLKPYAPWDFPHMIEDLPPQPFHSRISDYYYDDGEWQTEPARLFEPYEYVTPFNLMRDD